MSRSVRLIAAVAVVTLLFPGAAGAADTPSEEQLLGRLGKARVARHDETGRVRFIGAPAGAALPRGSGVGGSTAPERAARAFLAEYGSLFGVRNEEAELAVARVADAGAGAPGRTVRFEQRHRGVPVFAGELVVNLTADGAPSSVGGEILPDPGLNVDPAVTADAAREDAVAVTGRAHRGARGLRAGAAALRIYDPRLVGAPGIHGPRLVWQIEVTGAAADGVRELVLIDAVTGGVALHYNQVAHGKSRAVCDNQNQPADFAACLGPVVRAEGNPATGNADVDDAYDYSGATYDYYSSLFGRDSIDNAGMPLNSIVRFCDAFVPDYCPYPNAFWDGTTMVYGDGFAAADDVVAHELTHGVTEHESNLRYIFQSGAINEAMSDIFGELVDQVATANDTGDDPWLIGEDVPGFGALRDMQHPPTFGHPDRMGSELYEDDPTWQDNGGVHTNSGVANKAAYLMAAGDTFNGRTVTALGNEKTARIWYRVNTALLTSGSDYADLGTALPAACRALVGTNGIVAGDCTEVEDAVAATEMFSQPPQGQAQEARVCASGWVPTYVYSEDFEDELSTPEWARTYTVGGHLWSMGNSYATSGTYHWYGANVDVRRDATAYMKAGVTVPSGTAYARFRHFHDFEAYPASPFFPAIAYDGGVVEYSVNGGPWTDAGPKFSGNGYNARITSEWDNPLAGRSAFSFWSNGYISSRVDISAFAGQSIRFRFRMGTDSEGPWDGWYIDDFQIYRCRPSVDLQLTSAVDSPDPVGVGSQLSYTLTAKNASTQSATSVTTSVALPSSVTYLSAASGCTHAGGTAYGGRTVGGKVTCSIGTLAAGASASRAVVVGVVSAGTIAATGSVGGLVADPAPANNTAAISTTATYGTGQTSPCTVLGTSAGDALSGGSGANVLCGFGGNDTLTGNAGNDVVNGGPGTDRAGYTGAASGVTVNLGTRSTACYPGASTTCNQGRDVLLSIEGAVGSAYPDRLLGSPNADVLYGMAGNDTLDGAAGNDSLYGGDGNDSLLGQAGADKLYGENGNDTLNGGTESDTCSQGAGTGTLTSCP